MFIEWDFLLAEIWVLLALAALLGLFAGWLIWGGRLDLGADADEVRRLQAELKREKSRTRSMSSDPLDDIPDMQGGGYTRPTPMSPPATVPSPVPVPDPIIPVQKADPAPEAAAKPAGLEAPRDGLPDDLTKIKGIGRKLEKLCNTLGFWHYDQIAAWTGDEIAWVDENLEGFKGRVTRDQWVDQAKALAQNASPAFVRRKD
ncbi:NADH-quinone oxidoreductase subunit E [Octadecabacter sp. G9-8]|uniref:NADH-quinone oxidoreductase subunit E n=1 Tax=Octadecabacter dasysiphoniae TaxID=2909341 RepID=A0ABS9CYJ5_9RHOB|nr:NADH-quinone oxidoreductase subunit E [Octadecabacter dasysiphoniae]MCF2871143.1 NADH-quinone oxidoreductase subunit E [Octadecabacter dasysiphoniae]